MTENNAQSAECLSRLIAELYTGIAMNKKDLILEVERLKKLVFGESGFVGSNDDEIVLLKLRDYTTEILARVRVEADGFKRYYVMRGDGRCFCYGDYGVEWVKKLNA